MRQVIVRTQVQYRAREEQIKLELIELAFCVHFRLKLWFKHGTRCGFADVGLRDNEDEGGEEVKLQKLFLSLLITTAVKWVLSSVHRLYPYLFHGPLPGDEFSKFVS
jgi:hypothetical protein